MTLILLLFSFFSPSLPVECSSDGMHFFPEQREISQHSQFIVQRYLLSQDLVEGLDQRQVYLESPEGEKVNLELQELLNGQMHHTQAVFRPERPLAPDTRYYLRIAGATESERSELSNWNADTETREDIYWDTSIQRSAPLNEELLVEYESSEVIHYGCGPSVNAIFNVSNNTAPEIWYRTELIPMATKEKTSFYLKEWQGKLNVGHGMCAGAFKFARKGEYQVRFTPMTPDGQQLEPTAWVSFRSPFEGSSGWFGSD